jgi:hypothetical protein
LVSFKTLRCALLYKPVLVKNFGGEAQYFEAAVVLKVMTHYFFKIEGD